ncbi:hypothetical protein SLS59_002228 [Nothophoma quercina]|uniref:Triacylglycerol lipase n=1 Tax=Nothophoma quercina TaxID=749835 RepID=A0ABR3RS58_9PLEO
MQHLSTLALFGLAALSAAADKSTAACVGVAAISPKCKSLQAHYERDVFYVDGRLLNPGTGNTTVNQQYVGNLTLQLVLPLVFFHGDAVSGTTWLNTPDGRKGLASYFLDQGYQVYLIDHTYVGRSSEMITLDYILWYTTTQEGVQTGFTAPEVLATYLQATLHTQWAGTGRIGDAYFDAFHKGVSPFTSNFTLGKLSTREAGCELLSLSLDHLA